MKNIYVDVKPLEKKLREKIGLSEDVMIESASLALEKELRSVPCVAKFGVLVVCGSGNNGADGYALSRRIAGEIPVFIFAAREAKSEHCAKQRDMAAACGTAFLSRGDFLEKLASCAVVVDCLYGTGFHGELAAEDAALVEKINNARCLRIACDIPSGIDSRGAILTKCKNAQPDGNARSEPLAFKAYKTVAMGALKAAYFSDAAKDFCGEIVKGGVGVSSALFENAAPDLRLLEAGDMRLPVRNLQNVHKGNFGHVAVVAGEKPGAAILAGRAALNFGAGLVTLVEFSQTNGETTRNDFCAAGAMRFDVPPELMIANAIPENATAILLGSGLGKNNAEIPAPSAGMTKSAANADCVEIVKRFLEAHGKAALVLDADMFYYEKIAALLDWLSERNIRTVLTPHPKEFQSLLANCGLGEHSTQRIAEERLEIVKQFSALFPNITLALKGANTFVAHGGNVYVSAEGSAALAKAGSGDVLAGMTAALLAQGYGARDAATSAVLAHGIASRAIERSWSLTPLKLIDALSNLEPSAGDAHNDWKAAP